ncbi:hypothetical protein [Natronobeatus ordinarius]|uniref:hypothetical protein n=1 Tax=Natronobeatus ordinarius TaxID=2963433 RepID=UPI0020CB9592|nr:hypothetical protein [Natronobeatus ordinarius]
MTDANSQPDRPDDVPVWDDEYVDAVARRLMHHYDLERGCTIDGRRFELYGQMHVLHERHAVHPKLSFAHHETEEHVFATRIDRPTVEDFERLEALGERLADEWVDADEDHYSTDFSFVVVAAELPESVREFVSSYENRTLLRYGYYGHYEINLLCVVPERETTVASQNADVEQAFRIWEPIVKTEPGRVGRFLEWISR